MCSIMWKVEKPVKRALIKAGTPISRLEDNVISFVIKCLRKLTRKRKPKSITAEDYYDAISGRLP